eukprot:14003652-Alexandrium_andersonii.AAC.1
MSQDFLCCVVSLDAGDATAPAPDFVHAGRRPGPRALHVPGPCRTVRCLLMTQVSASSCPRTSSPLCPWTRRRALRVPGPSRPAS